MGGLGGIITGLLSKGGPSIDLSALYQTIQGAGQYQKQIINALPAEIRQNLETYAKSQNAAGDAYKTGVTGTGADYLQKVAGLYGPNSEAAQAQNTANRQQIYSTVPGTQNAIRNALAATGGLGRGNAATALASPYINAAQQYGQASADVNAKQTQMGQQATQQALATVASMDDAMFTNLFGMSKEQAQQILTSGNQALQTQLSQLINQSNTETNQMLGVQGLAANNKYQNDVADTAKYNSMIGNGVNLGLQGLSMLMPGGGASSIFGGMSGLPAGADVSSSAYMDNAAANSPFAPR